eukprot:TRINITY_DN38542_c0_g1_i1.p2 TRINITY_DN38542_c0_g1~~TRINITY_DN38542_c0_g1_i1.p2  ORF type:complete len:111 (-),score=20.78 TRINITY_DN38542_c0_g1_i1:88-420(-)
MAVRKATALVLVAQPLLGMPLYYAFRPAIEGRGWRPILGLQEFAADFRTLYVSSAAIWFPAHVATFSVVPKPLRVGWTAALSLAWLCFAAAAGARPKRRRRRQETESSRG